MNRERINTCSPNHPKSLVKYSTVSYQWDWEVCKELCISLPCLQELEESKDDKDAEKVTLLAISQKPLHKVIAEHKDVIKVVIALNNMVGNFKMECQDILNEFTNFSELWNEVWTLISI